MTQYEINCKMAAFSFRISEALKRSDSVKAEQIIAERENFKKQTS